MAARHRQHGKRKAKAERLAKVNCGDCGKPAGLVTGEVVYPNRPEFAAKPYWRCAACLAYVGCHPGTFRPLGTPAGSATRRARKAAHAAFDPLWRRKAERDGIGQDEARGKAYRWLAEQFGLRPEDTHIGMFDAATARRVAEVCAPFTKPEAA